MKIKVKAVISGTSRPMKDSGVEWIGLIPKDWAVKKVKNAFERKKEEAHQDDPVVLSLARSGVKLRDISTNEGQMAESYYNYNPVAKGDLLLNPMDLYSGANCSISNVEGVISPAYINLRARQGYDPRYYDYFFKTQYWSMAFFAHGKGVSFDNRWTLNFKDLNEYWIPVPSTKEQSLIADHLDKECTRIDSVIEKTRESIEQYKKLKQSIITEAVTKGIRPYREMKETGNDWIPSIPSDWDLSRVGLHFVIILGKMLCSEQPSSEYSLEPYYCAANVHFEGISNTDLKQMWFSSEEKKTYQVHQGDALIVEGGAGAGGCAIASSVPFPVFIQNSIMIVRSKASNANNRYLKYLLEYLVKDGYIDLFCNKATIPHFTKEKLSKVPFPISGEQDEIVDYLDEKCEEINSIIEKKETLSVQLESFKKSLIYECVTGKREL